MKNFFYVVLTVCFSCTDKGVFVGDDKTNISVIGVIHNAENHELFKEEIKSLFLSQIDTKVLIYDDPTELIHHGYTYEKQNISDSSLVPPTHPYFEIFDLRPTDSLYQKDLNAFYDKMFTLEENSYIDFDLVDENADIPIYHLNLKKDFDLSEEDKRVIKNEFDFNLSLRVAIQEKNHHINMSRLAYVEGNHAYYLWRNLPDENIYFALTSDQIHKYAKFYTFKEFCVSKI